jgi:penicillin-binding protein 1A
MDPNTGAVKAMIPGTHFDTSQYNVATHPYGLQMGSTWKVITLAAALDAGFSPDDSVSGATPCAFKGLGQTQNDEPGGGTMPIRTAIAKSVNCAFARIELAVGINNVVTMATKLGINPNRPSTPGVHLDPVLTLTLGTILATPVEMATVMSSVASGGIHHAPYFVQKIVGPDGNTLYEQSAQGDRVLSPDVANCEMNLLRGVVTDGTGGNANLSDRPVFGKTGTTDGHHNAAFYGGTPGQLVAFVWYGNKDANIDDAGFGGETPARIWHAFMQAQLAGAPIVPLPPPGPVCSRPGSSITDTGRELGTPATLFPAPSPSVVINPPRTTPTAPATTPTTAPAATTAPTTKPAAPPPHAPPPPPPPPGPAPAPGH